MEIDSPNATGVVSGFGVPTAGTSGQLLQKVDGTNYNTQWVDSNTPVYLSLNKSSAQAMTYNVETTVTNWTTLVNNTPSAWNNTTGTWTCPVAGIYDISFAVGLDEVAPTAIYREFAPIINHNGTIYVANFFSIVTSACKIQTTTVRTVLQLAVNDTIRPRVYQNLKDATNLNITTGRNHFIIKQLPGKILI